MLVCNTQQVNDAGRGSVDFSLGVCLTRITHRVGMGLNVRSRASRFECTKLHLGFADSCPKEVINTTTWRHYYHLSLYYRVMIETIISFLQWLMMRA